MPISKSSPSSGDGDQGRDNQKRRTRQALIDAAIALRDEGHNPTVAQVAERAMVSRATAYRYFPSTEALISETAADRDMTPLEQIWRPGDDPDRRRDRPARDGAFVHDGVARKRIP
jgi:AcrR family transcriptional regulator